MSIPIENNRAILNWMVSHQVYSFKNKKKCLSESLVGELTKIFGKPDGTLRLEFLTRCWVLKYHDLTFSIYTAKGKGTDIEICDYSFEDISRGVKQKEIIAFLEELHKQINLPKINPKPTKRRIGK